jgi:cyclophilin family peptidyl-prolyl cis-trans isomerase
LKKLTLLVSIFVLLVPMFTVHGQASSPTELCLEALPTPQPETRVFQEAEDVLQEDVDYYAIFCTSKGAVVVNLLEDETPVTVNNFVFLAQQGYYNNTHFHRVIPDFMAQGGDPTNTGTGGPGYQFQDEIREELTFDRPGLLAMANAGPGTNGSQFFITTAETPWLDGNHTIFGTVISDEYQQVVENIRIRDPQQPLGAGTALFTVLIVEGEDAFDVEAEVPAATRDEAESIIERLPETAPNLLDLYFNNGSALLSLSEASVSDADNDGFAIDVAVTSESCALEQFPLYSMDYRVITGSPDVESVVASFGDYEEVDNPDYDFTLLTRDLEACDTTLHDAVGVWTEGDQVVAARIVVTQPNAEIDAPLLVELVAQYYEELLYPILRPSAQ